VPPARVPPHPPGQHPFNEAKVVDYLALVDRQAPGRHGHQRGTTVDSALLAPRSTA